MKSVIAFTLLVVCVAQIQSGIVPLYSHTYDVNTNCEHPYFSHGTYAYSPYYSFHPTGYLPAAPCGCSKCQGVVTSHVAPYYANTYSAYVV